MPNVPVSIVLLEKYIQSVPAAYQRFAAEDLLFKPAPGKWSKLEILGHLSDSALNNLKRFTDLQYMPQPYTVQRYQQDDLVAIHQYQQLPLDQVLNLWKALNMQILHVWKMFPVEKLGYIVIIPNGEHKTAEWLIIDYIGHLEHHLKQVFGVLPG